MEQKKILQKELVRKSIHICSSFIPLLLSFLYWPTIAALLAMVIFYSISEFLRLRNINIPVISFITKTAAREKDDGKFVMGPVTLVIGIILTALMCQKMPCAIGIFSLAFGDGFASLIGKMFGKRKLPFSRGKTYAGSLGCFIASFISLFLLTKSSYISLIIAAATTLIESLPLGDFDNIIIPTFTGAVATLLIYGL
ncbi:MAG: phosphatidate cytidylyltransferase [Treponema sp.]|nr:phosphatidate cytidylyltransferase [Treponema sp.]